EVGGGGRGGGRGGAAALDPAIPEPPPARVLAAGAAESVRPAQPLQVIQAIIVGPEPGQQLPQRTRIVGTRHRHRHASSLTPPRWIPPNQALCAAALTNTYLVSRHS